MIATIINAKSGFSLNEKVEVLSEHDEFSFVGNGRVGRLIPNYMIREISK